MPAGHEEISVCICTFRRAPLLPHLLEEIEKQETEGLFSFCIVVVDNDSLQSARQVVADFAVSSSRPVLYCVEPEQNIALARNRAVNSTRTAYIAFIDDDEIPCKGWLCNLFNACGMHGADGVLGPVKPHFEHEPPQWVLQGRFFERPTHMSGHRLDWPEMRTGNVLLKRELMRELEHPFRPEFGTGGEDVDFFRRMTQRGKVFVWCNEAFVSELVPQSRCRCSYLLRRALNRGSNFPKRSDRPVESLLRSVVAVPLYALALPVALFLGKHMVVRYLIKLCDHSSRILAYLGWEVQRERAE